jgi:glycerophosphoryl diester phosphodiesterase
MTNPRTLLTSLVVLCMIAAVPARSQVIVGHRGASYDAPENTLSAYRLAWEQNADGGEGDFYLTKDGQIVCIHDATTKRTGDKNLDVAKSTLAELRTVDLGSWKNAKYAGERIPLLSEVLAIVPPGKLYYIEVKCGPEILPAIEKVIAAAPVKPEQLRIISFNAEVIAEAKKRLPHIKAHWITGFKQDKATKEWTPTMETVMQTLARTKADGLNVQWNAKFVTRDLVEKLKEMGLETAVWTVDDPKVARTLAEFGVFGLTTNRPGFLREELQKK